LKQILKCINCGETYSPDSVLYRCKGCSDLLDVIYDYGDLDHKSLRKKWKNEPIHVWKYRELLPLQPPNPVTLGEGGTPLHECERLAGDIGLKTFYAKNEGVNPTGSFKDRGMTVGINKALQLGMRMTVCASTGNTSASLSAYSAKAGLKCIVLVPSGKIASGKMAQAIAYGAKVLAVKGNFDDALILAQKLCDEYPLYLLNSVNPFRLEGQKTLAYEVFEQLGEKAPDNVIVPVGNAGNISAIWKGFCELERLGFTAKLPRMIGVQASGASPIATMIEDGREEMVPITHPETLATAIRIGSPVNWKRARRAVEESRGTVTVVSDEEIVEAQKQLARFEGLFVEPASASSLAGLKRLISEGEVASSELSVCVLTGHGLKDPNVVSKYYKKPVEVENTMEDVKATIDGMVSDRVEAVATHG
jgi:threonine synthase